jgi:hypothetical protein
MREHSHPLYSLHMTANLWNRATCANSFSKTLSLLSFDCFSIHNTLSNYPLTMPRALLSVLLEVISKGSSQNSAPAQINFLPPFQLPRSKPPVSSACSRVQSLGGVLQHPAWSIGAHAPARVTSPQQSALFLTAARKM